jgi:hypothetical protein
VHICFAQCKLCKRSQIAVVIVIHLSFINEPYKILSPFIQFNIELLSSITIFLVTNGIMRTNKDAGLNAFKYNSSKYVLGLVVCCMLFFSLDWLSLFLYKFLNDHRAAFWTTIGIHGILFTVCAIKCKSLSKRIKYWLYEKDRDATLKRSNDYCFYFKRD